MMQTMEEKPGEKNSDLAYKVMEACRERLFFKYRFLELALFRLPCVENQEIQIMGTEGGHFFFQADSCLKEYLNSAENMENTFLHMVMHCVFQHPFAGGAFRREYWNLACDMMTELVLAELGAAVSGKCRQVLNELENASVRMSAQALCRYFENIDAEKTGVFGVSFEEAQGIFSRDDHSFWDFGGQEAEISGQNAINVADYGENAADAQSGAIEQNAKAGIRESLRQEWKDAAEKIRMEFEAFSPVIGSESGHLEQALKDLEREKTDYMEFLKKFAVLQEVMETDLDEFDYIFYTYGLGLYGNVPLIEPLEYKEKYLVRDFVIALDTSGSCSGSVVQKFLSKTYNILKSTENYSHRVNIHIIQCDSRIQKHDVLSSVEELEEYIAGLRLFGFGGTDFRPVFAYVDELQKQHTFQKLGGLIYFTDGYGIYPRKPPGYKTAFVFVDQEEIPGVPAWAMRVVLDGEEIEFEH